MKSGRTVLLIVSSCVVVLVLGGGLAIRVGAADNPFRQVVRFSEVLSLVTENYVDPVDTDRILEGAYEGLLGGLDTGGTYLTPAEVESWLAAPSNSEADPGVAVLKAYGALVVVRVASGSPAETAGIEVGDQIRRIDGKPLRDLSLDQAVRMLRGKDGSSVTLGILHARESLKREDVPLRRAKRIETPFRVNLENGAAVVTVPDVGRIVENDLVAALKDARQRGASRLLVDLRDAAEGSPQDAQVLLRMFVTGDLLRRRERSGRISETIASRLAAPVWDLPVAVLVNGATAGGGEAVARVLQVRRGAKVYGEGTHGRAAEPKLFKLSNGAGILIPAYLWETPGGETWEGDGVKPDVVLTSDPRMKESAAEQLRRALEAFEKSSSTPEAPGRAA